MRKILGIITVISLNILCLTAALANATFQDKLVAAAIERTQHFVIYNGSYYPIDYPWGDVPKHFGVCSDVVIRAYRALGIDLQQAVHEDMKANFKLYPTRWGLKRPDPNIDHRRVLNLRVFFKRHGETLPMSKRPEDYKPGDLVTWDLSDNGSLPHIGIVTHVKSKQGVPLIVHNIGWGPKLEDMLFDFKITGHYRYQPQ